MQFLGDVPVDGRRLKLTSSDSTTRQNFSKTPVVPHAWASDG
jgi:hypothetical protein